MTSLTTWTATGLIDAIDNPADAVAGSERLTHIPPTNNLPWVSKPPLRPQPSLFCVALGAPSLRFGVAKASRRLFATLRLNFAAERNKPATEPFSTIVPSNGGHARRSSTQHAHSQRIKESAKPSDLRTSGAGFVATIHVSARWQVQGGVPPRTNHLPTSVP